MSLTPDYEGHWKKEISYFQRISYKALLETTLNPFIWESKGRIGLIFLIKSNAMKCLNKDLTRIPGVFLLAAASLVLLAFPLDLLIFCVSWALNIIICDL